MLPEGVPVQVLRGLLPELADDRRVVGADNRGLQQNQVLRASVHEAAQV